MIRRKEVLLRLQGKCVRAWGTFTATANVEFPQLAPKEQGGGLTLSDTLTHDRCFLTKTRTRLHTYTLHSDAHRQTHARQKCREVVDNYRSWLLSTCDKVNQTKQRRGKVTVPSQCSGMIPSALDKDDTYRELIPLK